MGWRDRSIARYEQDIKAAQKALKQAVKNGDNDKAEVIQDGLHQLRGNLRNISDGREDD